ncbi:MAG: tetratricopeptide repeat protein [Hymenobacter sp.]|nr:MAG: tetratricopeptide repeat protein [Hymenobacter sp.]
MRCQLILAVLTGVLLSHTLGSQTPAADSLRALLRKTQRQDTIRTQRLQSLATYLVASDLPQTTKLYTKALGLSQRLGYLRGEGNALIGLGTAARRQINYPLARRYTQQALAVFKRCHGQRGLARTYLQLSLIDEVPGANLVSALRMALKGLAYAEHVGDAETTVYLQYTLGDIYMQLGNYADALAMLQVTLTAGRKLGKEPVVAATLNLLGSTQQLLKYLPQAMAYFRQAAQLHRKLGDMKGVATDEINIAELYVQRQEYKQALHHGLEARALIRTQNDAYNLPTSELILARVYLATGQLNSAIALAQHGFILSQDTQANAGLASASEILAQSYAQRQDFTQAYYYQSLWVSYKDSLSGEETQRKTSALRYGYELDKKQSRIAVLSKEKQLQHQQLLGLLAGLGSTVLVLGLLWRNVYLKQRTNRALNTKNDQIAEQRDDLNRTLLELKATQSQLVQSEKIVALAALTAGVAHEIQNPLNFVNNFAEVSVELVSELEEEEQRPVRDPALEASLLVDLKQNLRKIHQYGARAGDIVKGMLEHARADAGQRQPIDLNAVAQDYLRLAYHDLQTKHRHQAVARTFDLDPAVGLLALVPQEIGRVLLNLFTNALYAVHQKATQLGPAYAPEVRVSTRRRGTQVELRIRDNGTGIPPAVVEKIYNPFFTTKPAGEGTGLGLWFSYDIITKGYGGTLAVSSQEGEYTEFVVTLPLVRSA